ncbi:ASKHA domain-containing protein [soil metagenome]
MTAAAEPRATAAQPLVIFTPSGRRGRFPEGTIVLDAARALGVDIDSVCGGRGICGRCQVQQSVGSFAKHGIESRAGHLSPLSAVEVEYREHRGLETGRRLSCVAQVRGDAVIDVPMESQVFRQVVRKGLDIRDFHIDPVVRLHYVQVAAPELASPSGDLARLQAALMTEWGLSGLEADLQVVRALQPALEAGRWAVTVAVHDGRTISAVWPGLHEKAYGVAIDVGSTTIAGHLAALSDGAVLASNGVMNPQIRFGEDLMSRVSYAMMHPEGAAEMTAAVRTSLNGLLAGLAAKAGIKRDDILELAVVGNPIMHHLLLGIDPVPLGSAPFALATDGAVRVRAAELELKAHPGARVYLLPCIAGHVGADTAGVILAEAPHQSEVVSLVVDVGTNAEIVLGDRHRLLAASSPTGPAFEGAQISGGQRAAPGAIERVRIDRQTLEPRFRVIGSEAWSDEAGFAKASRETGVTGICGSGIVEVVAELFLAGVVSPDGVIDGSLSARTPRVMVDGRTFAYLLHDGSADGRPRIVVTQNDVRAIQLAKAALYAGARLLMDQLNIETVDEVRLAGAFGSQIDPFHAMVLGLIPDCDLAHVRSAGNAAGTGALIALLSGAARREIEGVVRTVEKVETAVEPRFQQHFVEAMAFPHRTAAYPHLSRVVELPARPAESGGGRSERRRRRTPAATLPEAETSSVTSLSDGEA